MLGEAWMSALLAGLDESERFDARSCGSIGTSAGCDRRNPGFTPAAPARRYRISRVEMVAWAPPQLIARQKLAAAAT